MTRTPSEKVVSRRLGTAVDHARQGEDVVLVVESLGHIRQMMAELQDTRGAVDLVQVDRRNGAEQLRFRGGGRIRFAPAANPDSLRGWTVDRFLVDPRVATTTALEVAMQVACWESPSRAAGAAIVRPGDRP